MDFTIEQKSASWDALSANQSSMDKFLKTDQDVASTEGVAGALGFVRSYLGTASGEDILSSRNSNDNIGKFLVELMNFQQMGEESEEDVHNLLGGEIRRLLTDRSATINRARIDMNSASHLTNLNLREDDALLNSGSTEHAHHCRETDRKEHSAECEVSKSGAPSPASIMSYDFANNSYSLQQLDCQSDFTDSTGGHGQVVPFQTNISNITRRRNRQFSDALSDFAPSDAAEDTLSTQSIQGDQSDTIEETEDLDQDNDADTEDGSRSPSRSVDISNIAEASSANYTGLLDLSDTTETTEFSRSSGLGARDTFGASSQAPITRTEECELEIDTLVLPTVLSMHARSAVLNAFAENGAEVKRVNSSTAGLVAQFLATEAAQIPLVRNSGYLRILVVEASAGVVSASVVTVESPLRAENPDLNSRTASSDPADTMIADTTVNTPVHPSAFRSVSSEDAPGLRASSYVLPESLARPRATSEASVLENTTQVVSAPATPATPVATPASATAQSTSDSNEDNNRDSDHHNKTSSAQASWQHLIPEPTLPTVPLARSAVVRVESIAWARYKPSPREKKPSKAEPLCDFSVTGAARNVWSAEDRRVSTGFRNRRDSGGFPGSPGSPQHDYFALYGDEPQHRASLQQREVKEEIIEEEKKRAKEESPQVQESLEDALACCIQVVMTQQAVLHSPFNTSSSSLPTLPVDARRASYHSLSLDQRLFGLQTAAALHDLENGPHRDAVYQGGAPVPVLDSVLLWGGSKDEREGKVGEELTREVLTSAQEAVLPHLRDASDHAAMESLQASQLSLEGSFVALSPLSHRVREDARSRAASRAAPAVLPLFTLPVSAVWTGACVLQSLPCDLLRVFEGHQPVHCDTHTVSTPAVGLVIRPRGTRRGGDGVNGPSPIAAEEEVIWLYHPICANSKQSGGINARVDRECSLLLTQAPHPEDHHTQQDQDEDNTKEVKITAQECTASRRSCPLKPSVPVSAFVRCPPPDTACIVQPSSATYAAEVSLSLAQAERQDSGGGEKGEKEEEKVDNEGVLRENILFSPTPVVDTVTSPSKIPTTAHTTTSANPLVRLWMLLVGSLHYLIFPGTTYYIQYLQADLRDSTELPIATQMVTVAVPGVQRDAADGDGTVEEKKVSGGGARVVSEGWEVLVVTQPPLDIASHRNMRIVHALQVSTAPTFSDMLVALEQQCHGSGASRGGAEGGEGDVRRQKQQSGAFPACLVSLSAADNAGVRRFACRVMSPCPISTTTAPEDTTTSTASQSRRRKQAQAVQKRHFLALAAPSFELLVFREHQQRRIRAVRRGVKYALCWVLGVVGVLLLAVLVEVMYLQRQYAMQDAVMPDSPPDYSSTTITLITPQHLAEVVQEMSSKSESGEEVFEVVIEGEGTLLEEVVEISMGMDPAYISLSLEDLPPREDRDTDGEDNARRPAYFFETGRIGDAIRAEEMIALWAQGRLYNSDMTPMEPLEEYLERLQARHHPDPSASPVGPPEGAAAADLLAGPVGETAGPVSAEPMPVLEPALEAVITSDCATADCVSQSALRTEETAPPSRPPLLSDARADAAEESAAMSKDGGTETIQLDSSEVAWDLDLSMDLELLRAQEEVAEDLLLLQRERFFSLMNARDEQLAFDLARAHAAELAEQEDEEGVKVDEEVVVVVVEGNQEASILAAAAASEVEQNHPYLMVASPAPRLQIVRESIRCFLRSLQPRFQRCQQQLSEQQHRLYEGSLHSAARVEQALQHSVHAVATSEVVRAAGRSAQQAQRAVSDAVHTYGPAVYEALHVEEAKQWLGRRAALLQQDLLYLEEMAHTKPLRLWLQDRSVALRRAADSQRRAVLKSQAELVRDAGALLHSAGEGVTHLWQQAQQAAHSAGVALCDTCNNALQAVGRALQTGAQWCTELAAMVMRGVECVKQGAVRTVRLFV